jgi:hypothetical protein
MQVITPSAQPQRTAELLLNQRSDESEANRGRLRGEVVLIGRGVAEVGVPAVEVGEDQHRNRNARLALSAKLRTGAPGALVLLWGHQSFRTRYRTRSRWHSWSRQGPDHCDFQSFLARNLQHYLAQSTGRGRLGWGSLSGHQTSLLVTDLPPASGRRPVRRCCPFQVVATDFESGWSAPSSRRHSVRVCSCRGMACSSCPADR